MRNDPLYDEAINKIRGLKKNNNEDLEPVPETIGTRLISSSLMMSNGFGIHSGHNGNTHGSNNNAGGGA